VIQGHHIGVQCQVGGGGGARMALTRPNLTMWKKFMSFSKFSPVQSSIVPSWVDSKFSHSKLGYLKLGCSKLGRTKLDWSEFSRSKFSRWLTHSNEDQASSQAIYVETPWANIILSSEKSDDKNKNFVASFRNCPGLYNSVNLLALQTC
jgi:hypothetical protein